VPDAALIEPEVVDTPEASRYELRLGDRVIGFAAYRRRNDRVVFIHTEVDESYEGRGLGNRLAKAALDDVRGKGLVVVPLCPFIARYIQQHPEYHELVGTS
jgi:predicted GNAT family acetyltransferase